MKTPRLSLILAKITAVMLIVSGGGMIYSAFAATTATTLSVTISGSLNVSIVDSGGSVVGSPSVAMSATDWSNIDVSTSTGTLGVADQKIRVTNPTATKSWSLTIAATSGATTAWARTGGGGSFDFNDAVTGADGADADSVGGQLTIDPSGGSITGTGDPASGTGDPALSDISLGSSTAFAEGSADSITLATASADAEAPGQWDVAGISLSQKIPKRTPTGDYTLGLTLTLT